MNGRIAIGLVLAISACAPGLNTAGDPGNPPTDNVARLNVTNNYNGPMEIYAVAAGVPYRLGIVLPGQSGRFVLHEAQVNGGPVEFLAQLSSRERPVRSGQLLLAPGAIVDFTIATTLMSSTATVRP